MPPKESNNGYNSQPNEGNHGGNKRKAGQDQPSDATLQPQRKRKLATRRRGDPDPLPFVATDTVDATASRNGNNGATNMDPRHNFAPEGLRLQVSPAPIINGGIDRPMSTRQAHSFIDKTFNAARAAGKKNLDFTLYAKVEGAMAADDSKLRSALGADQRRIGRLRGPPPKRSYVEQEPQTCGNCGRIGHVAQACIKATSVGDIEACVLCNTKEHLLDDCKKWKGMDDLGRFTAITRGRANLPMVRCASEDCFQLAFLFPNLTEGYPWSRPFAINFVRNNGDLWKTYGYDFKTPILVRDPATLTKDVMRGNMELYGIFKSREALAAERDVFGETN